MLYENSQIAVCREHHTSLVSKPVAQPTRAAQRNRSPPPKKKNNLIFATSILFDEVHRFRFDTPRLTASAAGMCAHVYADAVLPVQYIGIVLGQLWNIGVNYGRPKMVPPNVIIIMLK